MPSTFTFTVNSTGDDAYAAGSIPTTPAASGTLRQAIQYADQNGGTNNTGAIQFSSGLGTISPQTALPAITQPNVTIDGGKTNTPGTPNVILNGPGIGIGLDIEAPGITVENLTIQNWGTGIAVGNTNLVQGFNILSSLIQKNTGDGIDIDAVANGTTKLPGIINSNQITGNAGNGISITGSSGNQIGDPTTPPGNLTGGNTINNNGGFGINVNGGSQDDIEINGIGGNREGGIDETPGSNSPLGAMNASGASSIIQLDPLTTTANSDGSVTVQGSLTGLQSGKYTVYLYLNPPFGGLSGSQGQTYLTNQLISTAGGGSQSFTIPVPAKSIPPGGLPGTITATVADSSGSSSAFSNPVSVSLASTTSTTTLTPSPIQVGLSGDLTNFEISPVALTATVTSSGQSTPTGSVAFYTDNNILLGRATLSDGMATDRSVIIPLGIKTVSAVYEPDSISSLGSSHSAPVPVEYNDSRLPIIPGPPLLPPPQPPPPPPGAVQLFLDGITLALDLSGPGGFEAVMANAALMGDINAAPGGFFNPILDAGFAVAETAFQGNNS